MKPTYVSPSQLASFIRCPRLWWAERVKKMPTIDKGHGHFGTVLHGVIQRWLEADDTGRDPVTGKPVVLYPPGWHLARNIFTRQVDGSVSPAEQLQIRRLLEIAIEQGDLRRWPGRECEVRMDREVIPGVRTWATIDVLLPDGITDHKSTKDMSWAKSKEELRRDVQLLFYAQELIQRDPTLEEVTFTHIYYSKNPSSRVQVKSVPVLLHKSEVQDGWLWIQGLVRDMMQTRELGPEHAWFDVAGPVNYASSCNQYGGCQFRPICGRKESIRTYADRVGRIQQAKQQPKEQERHVTMGLFDEMMGDDAPKSAPKAAPAPKTAKEPAKAAPSAPAAAKPLANGKIKVHEPPPWAIEGCPACSGVGFSTRGEPCRICVGRSEKDGGDSPSNYTITTDGDGYMVWEPRSEAEEEAPEEAAAEEPAAEEPAEVAAPEPRRGPGRPRKDAAAAPTPTPAPAAKTPPAKPTLYIGCLPYGIQSKDVSQVFGPLAADLAKSQKAEAYYKLDTWERREAIARVAPKVAEVIAGQHVVCNSTNPDIRAFVDALAEHCVVVRGVVV